MLPNLLDYMAQGDRMSAANELMVRSVFVELNENLAILEVIGLAKGAAAPPDTAMVSVVQALGFQACRAAVLTPAPKHALAKFLLKPCDLSELKKIDTSGEDLDGTSPGSKKTRSALRTLRYIVERGSALQRIAGVAPEARSGVQYVQRLRNLREAHKTVVTLLRGEKAVEDLL